MANNPEHPFPIVAIIVGIIGVVAIVTAFAYVFSPPVSAPTTTPTGAQPTLISTDQYEPEVIPPPYSPEPTQTATSLPESTPVPTQTLLVIPTLVSNRDLPDLIVSGLSDPVCAEEHEGTTIRFTIFVRNIGRARTGDYGSFDTDVFFILGQRRYSLEEWDTVFNSVVGTSIVDVSNLNPNDDIKFTVVIDLKGNKNFGIEVVANSGESPIREADMTNNTLIKYFSVYCY